MLWKILILGQYLLLIWSSQFSCALLLENCFLEQVVSMHRHLMSIFLHQMEAIVYEHCIWNLVILHFFFFLLLFQTSWEKRRPNSLDFVSHSRTCFANWGWSQEISLQGNKKVGGVFLEARNYSSWRVEFVQLQFGYSSCSKTSCHYQGNLCAFQTGMTFFIGLKQLLCTGLGLLCTKLLFSFTCTMGKGLGQSYAD